ncbi:Ras-related protein Rab-24 [Trichoplax sp. H2]|nr:Ras-related protein Rab-24 [Trichoplax sp. H2]|eukprot:RDD44774.1 Ras-related protein Rab-24 [Trichoplax sp. H2]
MDEVHTTKVVLLGRTGSGKTSLIVRYISSVFSENVKPTIGAAFSKKTVQLIRGEERKQVVLAIWDTAGDERYESMAPLYYRNSSAAIICFDLADRQSYNKVDFWVKELVEKVEQNCKLYICGTKTDLLAEYGGPLKRAVGPTEVMAYTKKLNAKFVETSSKSNYGIDDLFKLVAADFAGFTLCEAPPIEDSLRLQEPNQTDVNEKSSCCF